MRLLFEGILIELIAILLLIGVQLGLGSFVLFKEVDRVTLATRSYFIGLSVLFAFFNLCTLMNIVQIGMPLEVMAFFMPTGLMIYFLITLSDHKKIRFQVLLIGAFTSVFLTFGVYFIIRRGGNFGFVTVLPVLMLTNTVVGLIANFIKREDRDELFIKTVWIFMILGLTFIALIGTIALDQHFPNMQLTVNLIYLAIATQFLFEKYGDKTQSISGTILDPNYTDSDPYNLDQYRLTTTQKRIAQGLIEGLLPNEIAIFLNKSPETVHRHACDTYKKTGVGPMHNFVAHFRPAYCKTHPKPRVKRRKMEG